MEAARPPRRYRLYSYGSTTAHFYSLTTRGRICVRNHHPLQRLL